MRNQSNPASLQVELVAGMPSRLQWQGHSLRVTQAQSLEFVQSEWWKDWEHRGTSRRTYRVAVSDGRGRSFTADIVHQDSTWKLTKILD